MILYKKSCLHYSSIRENSELPRHREARAYKEAAVAAAAHSARYPLQLRLVFQRSLATTSCLQSRVPTRHIGLFVAVSLTRPGAHPRIPMAGMSRAEWAKRFVRILKSHGPDVQEGAIIELSGEVLYHSSNLTVRSPL